MDVIVVAGLLVGGLVLLIVGAEVLVRGASALATIIGISPLVVGLTVVAFGTSAPELAVGVRAGLFGQAGEADIALGNVIGSNIANILLILGLGAVINPLIVRRQLLRFDVPLMIGISFVLFFMSLDGTLNWLDGLMLFVGILVYTGWSIYRSRQQEKRANDELAARISEPAPVPTTSNWLLNIVYIGVGLAMLILGSDWLVNSATRIALAIGVSELVIGLTVVAVGTSLPEVATTLAATIKGERDLAVGNAVGSNIFNILLILGVTSLVAPGGLAVSQHALEFDFIVMLAVSIVCWPVFYTRWTISRTEGSAFLFYYAAYLTYLVLEKTSTQDTLSLFGTVMIGILLLTFVGIMFRSAQWYRREHHAPGLTRK
jgi:cation:H+ antiporter